MSSMVWSIYKDTNGDFNEWQLNDAAHYTDGCSTDARTLFFRDGYHDVWFNNHHCTVQVVDGKFDIEETKAVIGDMVKRDGYWGQFIEGFYLKDGVFHVSIGS